MRQLTRDIWPALMRTKSPGHKKISDMNTDSLIQSVKYDTQRSDYPTHQGLMLSSHIDYVWSSVDIISNFIDCKTVQLASTLTNHSIVILYVENFLEVKNNKRNILLKKVYDYDKMIEDKC
ncbi:4801_t:CDS:2 [Funneliformis geosporum]|uniref:4801_t:CDS:1 n=1 Tax=Funneliformis geosporum TaxID=1117311 RepID=A0A9W4SJP6_9GLOM|nr:4801_t:CDS:2 [Funneliformis geosporum]